MPGAVIAVVIGSWSCSNAQCQSEAKCEGIGLKNISYSHANKIRKDFTLTLVLKVRVFVTVGKEEAQRIFHLALTNEIRRLQISSPGSCGRHIEKRENPGDDVAHMYHGGLWSINIEAVIISLFLHFS